MPLSARNQIQVFAGIKVRFTPRICIVINSVLLTAMYLGWPNASFIEAEDSITFYTALIEGTATFHPNHLLFEPAYQTVLQALPGLPALLTLQTVTSLFALLGLAGIYNLIAPRNGRVAALLTTWLTATTFTYWHYGKVIDAYVPALACAIWSMVFFDRHIARASKRTLLLAALALSTAVLFHQLYCVLALLMCLALLRHCSHAALLFAATGLVLVGGTYAHAYLSLGTDHSFLAWCLGRAEAGLWDPPDANTPIKAAMGLTRVFIHSSALFTSNTLATLANDAIGPDRLVEEMFLAQTALTSPVALTLPLLAIAYAIALIALFTAGIPRIAADRTTHLLVAAIFAYTPWF